MEQTEKTILPFSVLAGLYKSVLISPKGEGEAKAIKSAPIMQEKRIPVLIQSNESSISPAEKIFLSNIMTACKLQENEYITLATNAEVSIDYLTLKAQYEARFVLLFGIEPSAIQLPMQFPHFQIQSFQGCQYLYAPPLEIIEQDKSLKVQLWQCLKKMFP